MPRRPWLMLSLLATLTAGCGGDAGDTEDTAAGDTAAAAAEEQAGGATIPAGDSIPTEITVTTSGGPSSNNGTFSARGMSSRCTHDPEAQPGTVRAAWTVNFGSEDTTGVQLLLLEVGAPVGDTTSEFSLTLAAGTSTAAGMTMPMRYMVATWPGGSQLGSGSVTVKRQGAGARFDVNAIDGASKTRIVLSATCERLGSVD